MVHSRVLCCLSFTVIFCVHSVVAYNHKLTSKSKTPWNLTVTDRLKHDLLLHYDKYARPTEYYNTTTVDVDLSIYHFTINEFKNTFTVFGYIRLEWKDEKLKWNASNYEGVTYFHVADHEIWQPDIVPYNRATGSTMNRYTNTQCLVYADGTILYAPHLQFDVFCQLNLRFWPFDEQKCFVRMGSWTYHLYAVNVTYGEWQPETDILLRNSEWSLINITKERSETIYPCCTEPYPAVTFNFTIQRVSPSYKALVITPTFAIIAMTLLNFWLPPHAQEKLFLNCCTAILSCFFLLFFYQKNPALSDHTPLIILLYSNTLYVICFCLIGSVIVICIARTKNQISLPWMIKNALTGCLGRWLCLSSLINQISNSGSKVMSREGSITDREESHEHIKRKSATPITKNKIINHEWLLLATAIDRLSFVFYAILFGILVIQTLI